jgi:hypothetical protein
LTCHAPALCCRRGDRVTMTKHQIKTEVECNKHGLQKCNKNSRCKLCDREKALKYDSKHRDEIKVRHKQYRMECRLKVFCHYSNSKIPFCACCGDTIIEFLTLDHIDGDGAKHRKEIEVGAGAHTYKWVIDNNFPPIFRVLCYNCNCSRGSHGYCPHERMAKITQAHDE